MRPITEIADWMGIDPDHVSPYGKYKAKLSLDAIREGGHKGKMILITAITPTRAGEGKTTTTVGLTTGAGQARVPGCGDPQGALVGSHIRHQGWRHWWRRIARRAAGRGEHPLHRRRTRRVVGPQSPGGADRQRGPARPDRRLPGRRTSPGAGSPTWRTAPSAPSLRAWAARITPPCASPVSTSSQRPRSWPSWPLRPTWRTCARG